MTAAHLPADMHAAWITAHGGPEALHLGRLPVPQPGPTDVLLRMQAAALNPVDVFVCSGAYRTHLPFPFVPGRDVVGRVVAAGPGVSGIQAGDVLWSNSLGHGGRQGVLSEYVLVPVDRAYRLPAGVTAHDAVAVLHCAATAWLGLWREANLRAGECVFVEGAAGGVGSAVVHMAARAGARVIATAASADHADCLANGASAVLDYQAPDRYARLRRLAPEGIDVWWDTSGHYAFAEVLGQMRPRGRVIIMAGLGRSRPVLPVGDVYTRDVRLCGFAISNAGVADLAQAARAINRSLAEGGLRAREGARYPLAEADTAFAALVSQEVRGRILVIP
ncbi:MAG: NADPH:quinone reductase [Castellaniella sp.]